MRVDIVERPAIRRRVFSGSRSGFLILGFIMARSIWTISSRFFNGMKLAPCGMHASSVDEKNTGEENTKREKRPIAPCAWHWPQTPHSGNQPPVHWIVSDDERGGCSEQNQQRNFLDNSGLGFRDQRKDLVHDVHINTRSQHSTNQRMIERRIKKRRDKTEEAGTGQLDPG